MTHFLGYFAGCLATGLAWWVARTFANPSIDQILYHLRFSDGAAVQMGEIFLMTLVVEVLVFPLLFAIGFLALHLALTRWRGSLRPLLRWAPALAVGAGCTVMAQQLSAFSYVGAHFGPDRFRAAHVDPQAVRIGSGQPRNLVLIYAESLENGYGDARQFGRDLLAPLKEVGGTSFPAYRQVAGTNWTIAGIVATQCGVPLGVYSEYDIKRSGAAPSFLPGARCLGDVLRDRGYRNVFLGGASLSFAGKGSFLRDHGYAETYGREEWERAGTPPEAFNEWGLQDAELFARARDKLAQLHAAGRPFNLTLLTIDTHNPLGFRSPHCTRQGARDFDGIVGCAADQIAQFIHFAARQGYLADTVVVVLGDHLAVPNPAYERLLQTGPRTMFNLFVGTDLPPRHRDEIVPFDLFPSLLELVGAPVSGGRMALGYSAFGDPAVVPPPTRLPDLNFGTLGGSAAYRALWEAPQP